MSTRRAMTKSASSSSSSSSWMLLLLLLLLPFAHAQQSNHHANTFHHEPSMTKTSPETEDVVDSRKLENANIFLRRTSGLEKNQLQQSNERPVEVKPFQLMLEYDNGNEMTAQDEMSLLTTTQEYLTTVISKQEPFFSRLILYQYVRDFPDPSSHFAKIAFGGTAYFFVDSMDPTRLLNDICVGLIGPEKASRFVAELHDAGMIHISNATVLSMKGNMIGWQDGQMVEMDMNSGEIISSDEQSGDVNAASDTDQNEMDDDMKMVTLLMALLIPGGVLCLACTVFSYRFLREINWTMPATNPTGPEWQTSQHPPTPTQPSPMSSSSKVVITTIGREYKEEEKEEIASPYEA